jgi:hypothetical protein
MVWYLVKERGPYLSDNQKKQFQICIKINLKYISVNSDQLQDYIHIVSNTRLKFHSNMTKDTRASI